MGYWNEYQPENIKPNIVSREGIYQVKIIGVEEGSMSDKSGNSKRYTQVTTIINAEGYPRLSLFLTEGPNFNGVVTAFFDTFGIERGNQNSNTWINKTGRVKITLQKKGEYTNMIPHYLVDESGYVTQQQNQARPQQAQQQSFAPFDADNSGDGDIPF